MFNSAQLKLKEQLVLKSQKKNSVIFEYYYNCYLVLVFRQMNILNYRKINLRFKFTHAKSTKNHKKKLVFFLKLKITTSFPQSDSLDG